MCVCRVGKNEAESGAIGCRMMQCLRREIDGVCIEALGITQPAQSIISGFRCKDEKRLHGMCPTHKRCFVHDGRSRTGMRTPLLDYPMCPVRHIEASFTMVAPEPACEPRY